MLAYVCVSMLGTPTAVSGETVSIKLLGQDHWCPTQIGAVCVYCLSKGKLGKSQYMAEEVCFLGHTLLYLTMGAQAYTNLPCWRHVSNTLSGLWQS